MILLVLEPLAKDHHSVPANLKLDDQVSQTFDRDCSILDVFALFKRVLIHQQTVALVHGRFQLHQKFFKLIVLEELVTIRVIRHNFLLDFAPLFARLHVPLGQDALSEIELGDQVTMGALLIFLEIDFG